MLAVASQARQGAKNHRLMLTDDRFELGWRLQKGSDLDSATKFHLRY